MDPNKYLKIKENHKNRRPKNNPRNPRKRSQQPTENPPLGSK
jgi:hypothetical protein